MAEAPAGAPPPKRFVEGVLAAGCDEGVALPPPKRPPAAGFEAPPPNSPPGAGFDSAWPVDWPKRLVVGLGESAGGAPAGVVDPRALNRGFAGVACPVDANRELVPAAVVLGVELAAVVAGLFAPPKRLGLDALAPPKRPPPVAAPAVEVGVPEAVPPNRLDEAGLLAPLKRLPPAAGVLLPPAPPPNRPPPEGVVDEAAPPPNRPPAGF